MADITTRKPRRRERHEEDAPRPPSQQEPQDQLEQQDEPEREEEPRGGEQEDDKRRDEAHETLFGELRDTIREAAIEVLRPVAKQATTSAAKYAVAKGPDMVKDKVMPKVTNRVTDAGGAGALAKGTLGGVTDKLGGVTDKLGGVTEKFGRKGGGKKPTGTGRGRRLPVQEYVDVAVDIETAYDQYTQFEDFPQFMHRVERVEQRDDTTLVWHENIWGVRRQWEAEIVEQKPCERIVWRATSGPQTVGVVTFHKLADNLTRVYVNLDFQPQGMFEKTASGLRLSRRALRSDLMRFKAFVEMRNEPTGAWRGVVEEGDVVDREDEDQGEEREEREEPEAEESEEYEDEGEEEEEEEEEPERPRASEEDEDVEEEEEEEEPRRPARPRRPRARARTASSTARRR